jgi:hypothetical protein
MRRRRFHRRCGPRRRKVCSRWTWSTRATVTAGEAASPPSCSITLGTFSTVENVQAVVVEAVASAVRLLSAGPRASRCRNGQRTAEKPPRVCVGRAGSSVAPTSNSGGSACSATPPSRRRIASRRATPCSQSRPNGTSRCEHRHLPLYRDAIGFSTRVRGGVGK